MKVLIKKVDWYLSEEIKEGTVTFQIGNHDYHAFSILDDYPVGEQVEVEFDHLSLTHDPWNNTFDKNPQKKKCLINTKDWSYDGYGRIISVNPIRADFGDIVLDLGKWSHDKRLIGEYIYWPISELSVSRNKE
ncbi:MAG: hypothetical protein JW774_02555 [Candidatus Aureabacteria bacterium]|nr:hypothetical protein [Candidatus Auribacterota bacterium]